MSNNKLTTDRAVKYWGAEVMYPDGSIHRVNTRTLEYIECEEDCKLLLTPQSQIIEEHGMEVANIMGFGSDPVFKHRVMLLLCQKYGTIGYMKPMNEYRDVIDLLRKYSYDIDNAIEEGWAIDKTQKPNS